ncbi:MULTISPECIES: hypothetical protein [unclassified Pseudoalteromonas]|uniref:hypothetical protein n=1 Tax=unclassified Pseudoalteromonas TaxID=194690 RepID=UPI000C33DDCD|nr:hypothetical protein [Pseudoalteromonas sp. 78C3]PKH90795.1 hypothetical protein CXF76_14675 [Pseudoalteromonas sp. 78C3]
MRASYSAMYFVYVQWLKKRSKSASGADGVFAFSLILLLNCIMLAGVFFPHLMDTITSVSRVIVCLIGIVLLLGIAILNGLYLGSGSNYINNVKRAFRANSKKRYFVAMIIWLFGSIILVFPLLALRFVYP